MLTILRNDPMYPIQHVQSDQMSKQKRVPHIGMWGVDAIAWPVPSSKVWKAITAVVFRVLSMLWWAQELNVNSHNEGTLNGDEECTVAVHVRLQETMLKIVDQLF